MLQLPLPLWVFQTRLLWRLAVGHRWHSTNISKLTPLDGFPVFLFLFRQGSGHGSNQKILTLCLVINNVFPTFIDHKQDICVPPPTMGIISTHVASALQQAWSMPLTQPSCTSGSSNLPLLPPIPPLQLQRLQQPAFDLCRNANGTFAYLDITGLGMNLNVCGGNFTDVSRMNSLYSASLLAFVEEDLTLIDTLPLL